MGMSGEEATEPPFRNIFPTETTTTVTPKKTTSMPVTTTMRAVETPEERKESFMGLIRVMNKLSNADNVPANLSRESFNKKIEVSRLIGEFLDPLGKNHEKWEL